MSLYESWIKKAFSKDGKANEEVWDQYLPLEQKIYEEILSNKITKIEEKEHRSLKPGREDPLRGALLFRACFYPRLPL